MNNPTTPEMFERKNEKTLTKEKAEIFHRTVAKGLFLSKKARLDIQPIIACLCTRVKDPTEGDWNKLVKMMKYFDSSKVMTLTMSAENGINCIAWYIDASFGVHPDYKSHTGAIMKSKGGKGSIITMSRKQKLMIKS